MGVSPRRKSIEMWWFERRGERRQEFRQVVPNGVSSPQANPLGNGTVLLLRFGELLLRPERLVAL